jgi:cell division protease FtsH
MVTEYGMSDRLGLVTYESPRQPMFLPENYTAKKTYSETKATQIDEEIASVMEQAHQRVQGILAARRQVLDKVAHLLLEEETVEGKELRRMLSESANQGSST